MFEPRTPARIQQLCAVMENNAGTADQRSRSLMVAELYLLAEDMIGRESAHDVALKARIRRLIAKM